MKKAIYLLAIIASTLLVNNRASAQDYKMAVGLKFGGYENGISGKYFVDNSISYEGILGFRQHGVVVTGLYEVNHIAFSVPALKFYYGFGAHIGSAGQGTYRTFSGDDRTYTSPKLLLGGDGTIGLDYLIPDSPIAVSIDLNPRIELATGPFFDLAPGLGLKYVFK